MTSSIHFSLHEFSCSHLEVKMERWRWRTLFRALPRAAPVEQLELVPRCWSVRVLDEAAHFTPAATDQHQAAAQNRPADKTKCTYIHTTVHRKLDESSSCCEFYVRDRDNDDRSSMEYSACLLHQSIYYTERSTYQRLLKLPQSSSASDGTILPSHVVPLFGSPRACRDTPPCGSPNSSLFGCNDHKRTGGRGVEWGPGPRRSMRYKDEKDV